MPAPAPLTHSPLVVQLHFWEECRLFDDGVMLCTDFTIEVNGDRRRFGHRHPVQFVGVDPQVYPELRRWVEGKIRLLLQNSVNDHYGVGWVDLTC